MDRIEETRARLERLKTPHRVKIDVSGAVDIAGLAPIYSRAPVDLEFLLAEVDRLQSHALPAIVWITDDNWLHTRKVATVGEIVLTWWPYNQACCIGTVKGIGPLAENKDEDHRYNGGNAGQRACEAAYYKVIGLNNHPPLSAVEHEEDDEEKEG